MFDNKQDKEKYLDALLGSMIGGAAGDALGYVVEFLLWNDIQDTYGKDGITAYDIDKLTNKALISDDTQMSLFTANGILYGETSRQINKSELDLIAFVEMAYQDWLFTQSIDLKYGKTDKDDHISWLLDVPQLYACRAPGRTCINALLNKRSIPTSKGCGGIMRIAPLGLYRASDDIKELDVLGAKIVSITHGHSLGYMPAAILTHILNRIVYAPDMNSLETIILEARDTLSEIYADDKHIDELCKIMNLAIDLAKNDRSDLENIQSIGEGWVAEETLAIALYCSLRYEHDFSKGIIASVNHDGDSDSTGAVTGNILGAINGYSLIEDKWKHDLELHDVIYEMATDLCIDNYDEDWKRKYIYRRWKNKSAN